MPGLRRWAAAALCGLLCWASPAAGAAAGAAVDAASMAGGASKPVPDQEALERAEFAAAKAKKVDVFLKMLDTNADGFLTADEVQDKVATMVKQFLNLDLNDPSLASIVAKGRGILDAGVVAVDVDGDSRVSAEELNNGFATFQDTMQRAQSSFLEMVMKQNEKQDL